ncbi:MAG TPA: hypothetical protein VFY79_04410 [Dehalococcoidia bacterium]|nr:hypothetical protein [Dehalococcoidia bacterium]
MQGPQSGRRGWGAGFLLLACALCLFASLAAPPSGAEASSSGTLVLNAPDGQPSAGETFAVTIDLNNAAGVHEFNAYLLYNPNVVQVLDADPSTSGTQVLPGPFPGGGSVTANSAAGGSIQYAYALPGNAEATGSGTIATVQFRALRDGDAGLQWGTVTAADGTGAAGSISTSVDGVSVGGGSSAAATGTPVVTDTPASTATAGPTDTATAAASDTPASTATIAGSATATPTGTRTATVTRTPTVTHTPSASVTARPTSTPRITVIQNSNASPTLTINQKLGVDGTVSKPKNSLPDAGNNGPGPEWWRWTFFAAALMLGIAGWFFTFAIHHSDRDVILLDRHDRRRRRH